MRPRQPRREDALGGLIARGPKRERLTRRLAMPGPGAGASSRPLKGRIRLRDMPEPSR